VTLLALLVLTVSLRAPDAAAHAERPSHFPDPSEGSVPRYRTSGPSLVVCKPDSRTRIERSLHGSLRERNLGLLERCDYRDIQAAVDAAGNGYRILILPGIYREEPSRRAPEQDPRCEGMYAEIEFGSAFHSGTHEGKFLVPSYEYHRHCPNANQLIAIAGDDDDRDRVCDDKCNLQIEGTGRQGDVLIVGDKRKRNVIKADRSDGIYLRNFTIQYAGENNIYIHETNGFNMNLITSRWAFRYGFLTFTSDHGLYQNLEAFGHGDSGVYPGSGPECKTGASGNARYGIEIRDVDSHGNLIGYSGTAGNGVYAHDNRFHHNSAGATTDSFVAGHPGMPQDCAKFEDNAIYSNNLDLYSAERDEYCKKPEQQRDPEKVCPHFGVPIGVGIMIAGGNQNVVARNRIYDNWRDGTRLFYVPAAARGEGDPRKQYDTSFGNRHVDNRMGVRLDGTPDPNGVDFWWDEENGYSSFPEPGMLNCWQGNVGPSGGPTTSDPPTLPACTGAAAFRSGNSLKQASQVSCATWDPQRNTDPPGCDWFTVPPEPRPVANGRPGEQEGAGSSADDGGRDRDGGLPDGRGGDGSAVAGANASGSRGRASTGERASDVAGLPFTGFPLALLLTVAVSLVGAGLALRLRARAS
jgi:hypothetical protein